MDVDAVYISEAHFRSQELIVHDTTFVHKMFVFCK